jgi:hypothetical protein
LRTESLQEAALAAFVMLLWIGVHNSWNLKSNDEWVAGNKAAAEYWQSLIAAGSKGTVWDGSDNVVLKSNDFLSCSL